MAKSFEETVSDLTEEFGTRGFTAKKTAAADLLGGDIEKARGENASESIVVASVLDNLETAQRDLESSRDPETSKEILKTVNDLKQVVKQVLRSNQKTILLAIYNTENQRRYIGVKLD